PIAPAQGKPASLPPRPFTSTLPPRLRTGERSAILMHPPAAARASIPIFVVASIFCVIARRARGSWVGYGQEPADQCNVVGPVGIGEQAVVTDAMERDGTLPIAVDADFERFIAARRALLNERLAATDVKAKGGLLPDVMLDKGVLKITPIEKSTPPEAEALAARLYAMLPRIRITDLLSEVARWTLFTDCFTHLRTGETDADSQVLMASLLADGLNLGLTRIAQACSIASRGQPAW